jgi:sterol desaturase/sphingolipid hydroxylase (fatty acid hydroxylase superfamily)
MPISMAESILTGEPAIRLGIFVSTFAVMAVWEWLGPRRGRSIGRVRRWPNNIGVAFVDTILARVAAPAGAVGFALYAQVHRWGLFNSVLLPAWLKLLISLVALDFAIYLQHRLFHYVPALWRLHRMHHADLEIDVTTGARFHPIEILLSLGVKFLVIVPMGAPPLSVLIFEIGLNASSMFNHGNVRIPAWLDRLLRWLVVTPDMHRVHHSVIRRETDSNFGFNFPWWDRLFKTYRAQPEAGHQAMTIGIEQFRDPKELFLGRMLTQPFRNEQRSGAKLINLAADQGKARR